MTESQITVAEEQIVRLKKKELQNLSCKIILMGGSEAKQNRFSDSSGLYIAINLIYSIRYKIWSNEAYKDMHNLFFSHLEQFSSS